MPDSLFRPALNRLNQMAQQTDHIERVRNLVVFSIESNSKTGGLFLSRISDTESRPGSKTLTQAAKIGPVNQALAFARSEVAFLNEAPPR